MTLVGEIKLESLIAGQHSTTRGNRSDHMNDKQAFLGCDICVPVTVTTIHPCSKKFTSQVLACLPCSLALVEPKCASPSQQDALIP